MALTGAVVSSDAIWETIAREAEQESALWAAALRPRHERELVAVFSPLAEARFALGLESIYEGYLLHYGRARLFAPPDRETTILLGDYLHAHGLVRIAALGDVDVVADLAELLSLCAQLRADHGRHGVPDGLAWAATVVVLGHDGERLEKARAALRDGADAGPLARVAESHGHGELLATALARHAERVAD